MRRLENCLFISQIRLQVVVYSSWVGYNSGKPDTTVQIYLRSALKDGEELVIEPSRQKEQWDQIRDTHVHDIWGTTQNGRGCFTVCMGWVSGVSGAEASLGLHREWL